MEGTMDEMKGRAKEAAGSITDDSDLKREGRADQAASKVKQTVEDAKDWVDGKVDALKR